ncbi:EAL domain-containing protein [Marinomonas primoryensis]|jgi:sensor c-di-GMP phosphodiesterase-like protein|uniref:EAL domain-containing protein n=1 Tax=Marinomonas primoryensis TaxID=178399 RepID=UPI0037040A38
MLKYVRKKSIILDMILSALVLPSWKNLLFFVLLTLCFSLYIHHWSALTAEQKKLESYVKKITDRTQQSVFQLKTSLILANQSKAASCSPEDINMLRDILANYPYVNDIGRISSANEVTCSVLWGVLSEPKKLPNKSIQDSSFQKSWTEVSGFFSANQQRSIFNIGHSFAVSSPTTFLDISRHSQKIGGVLYTPTEKKIHHLFDDITYQQAQSVITSPPKQHLWLPILNNFLVSTYCPPHYEFCVTGVDTRIGIYDMSIIEWLKIIISGILAGVVLSFGIKLFKSNRRTLIYRLKYAIKTDDIYSLYQPKIHLKTGKIIGVEALARWDDKELGSVSPDVFIHCAEANQLITPLTKKLIVKNLKEIGPFLKNDPTFLLSINLSVQDLSDQSFLNFVDNHVKKNGINAEQIIFEVTERSAAENNVLKRATKHFLRKGYQISLDDFGTGFSNLSWLTTFEPNEIKIDKMFVQSIGTQTVSQIALNGIFQLVGNLNVALVFEGIESVEEARYVLQHSPNAIGQGWLYSKAIDVEALQHLLDTQPYMDVSFLESQK